MMSLKVLPAIAACAILVVSSGAFAANYGAGTSGSTPPPAKTQKAPVKQANARTPESIQCSKEADTKGLHGKDRQKFRASCKTALKAHKPMPGATKS